MRIHVFPNKMWWYRRPISSSYGMTDKYMYLSDGLNSRSRALWDTAIDGTDACRTSEPLVGAYICRVPSGQRQPQTYAACRVSRYSPWKTALQLSAVPPRVTTFC